MVNYMEQLRLCLRRDWDNIVNNKAYTVTNIVVSIIQSLVSGSLYYNIPSNTKGAFSRGGVIFFAMFYFVVMGLAQIDHHHHQDTR